jgi:hypothetical protein
MHTIRLTWVTCVCPERDILSRRRRALGKSVFRGLIEFLFYEVEVPQNSRVYPRMPNFLVSQYTQCSICTSGRASAEREPVGLMGGGVWSFALSGVQGAKLPVNGLGGFRPLKLTTFVNAG